MIEISFFSRLWHALSLLLNVEPTVFCVAWLAASLQDRSQSDEVVAKVVAEHVATVGPTSAFQLAQVRVP